MFSFKYATDQEKLLAAKFFTVDNLGMLRGDKLEDIERGWEMCHYDGGDPTDELKSWTDDIAKDDEYVIKEWMKVRRSYGFLTPMRAPRRFNVRRRKIDGTWLFVILGLDSTKMTADKNDEGKVEFKEVPINYYRTGVYKSSSGGYWAGSARDQEEYKSLSDALLRELYDLYNMRDDLMEGDEFEFKGGFGSVHRYRAVSVHVVKV